jgi:hypothetical protein
MPFIINAGTSTLDSVDTSLDSLNTKMTQGSNASLANAQQVVSYGRSSGGTLYPLTVGSDGRLRTQAEHTWTTSTLFDAETIADTASATSLTLDLGSEGHAPSGGIANAIYLSLSATISSWYIDMEVSPDGITWYTDKLNSTHRVTGTCQETVLTYQSFYFGDLSANRYSRFVFYNDDGLGTSTNVTLIVSGYF